MERLLEDGINAIGLGPQGMGCRPQAPQGQGQAEEESQEGPLHGAPPSPWARRARARATRSAWYW